MSIAGAEQMFIVAVKFVVKC